MNQNILKKYFENVLGVSSLKIRIGIDFGDDDEVLWSKYGIDNINEVTVTSLHADLSSKLQNKASENSIMVGENVFHTCNYQMICSVISTLKVALKKKTIIL